MWESSRSLPLLFSCCHPPPGKLTSYDVTTANTYQLLTAYGVCGTRSMLLIVLKQPCEVGYYLNFSDVKTGDTLQRLVNGT